MPSTQQSVNAYIIPLLDIMIVYNRLNKIGKTNYFQKYQETTLIFHLRNLLRSITNPILSIGNGAF
jgi:hypothetical protein